MSEPALGVVPLSRTTGESKTTYPHGRAAAAKTAADTEIEEARRLVQLAHQQLARDFADIERATLALRRAELGLQSWSQSASPPAVAKAQPVWLFIGVLWLSTVIATVGAATTIAVLAH